MLAAGIETPVPLDELEIHLREEIEQQMKSGLSEQETFNSAVQKIGQAHLVQNEFKKVEATRDVIIMMGTTLSIALMLVGIPFVNGLGFAFTLFVTMYGLLQMGRRKHAWLLFLVWATSGAINFVLLMQKDGALAHAFVRESLPLWYRALLIGVWLVCMGGCFWERRKTKNSPDVDV